MTHDCRLGWHHAAQLIADRMPASFNPNAPRLVRVPLPENARALDVDPAKASKPAAAPAAALVDGWIQCNENMPNLPFGTYEYRNNGSSVHTRPLATNLRDLISPGTYSKRQYRLLPKEPA